MTVTVTPTARASSSRASSGPSGASVRPSSRSQGGPVGSHATLNDDPGGLPWNMAEGGPARVGAPLVGKGGILPERMLGSAVRLGGPGTDRYAWGRDAAVVLEPGDFNHK